MSLWRMRYYRWVYEWELEQASELAGSASSSGSLAADRLHAWRNCQIASRPSRRHSAGRSRRSQLEASGLRKTVGIGMRAARNLLLPHTSPGHLRGILEYLPQGAQQGCCQGSNITPLAAAGCAARTCLVLRNAERRGSEERANAKDGFRHHCQIARGRQQFCEKVLSVMMVVPHNTKNSSINRPRVTLAVAKPGSDALPRNPGARLYLRLRAATPLLAWKMMYPADKMMVIHSSVNQSRFLRIKEQNFPCTLALPPRKNQPCNIENFPVSRIALCLRGRECELFTKGGLMPPPSSNRELASAIDQTFEEEMRNLGTSMVQERG
jgi:hypothetical protein